MTEQQTLTSLDLDDIAARAAALYEYATVTDPDGQAALNELTDTDVPALLDTVRRLRAAQPMVCINCETSVGWVDCPTGGWWAHETHPEDGHDADPRPAVPAAVETGE
jgi:hypothetical protein